MTNYIQTDKRFDPKRNIWVVSYSECSFKNDGRDAGDVIRTTQRFFKTEAEADIELNSVGQVKAQKVSDLGLVENKNYIPIYYGNN